jgi:hypothetical protein
MSVQPSATALGMFRRALGHLERLEQRFEADAAAMRRTRQMSQRIHRAYSQVNICKNRILAELAPLGEADPNWTSAGYALSEIEATIAAETAVPS